MTSSTIRRRSSYGANPASTALTARRSTSADVRSNAAVTAVSSDDGITPLISRLSVFTPTENPARRNGPIGCSTTLATAPICTLHVGASSRWIWRSST